MSFDKLVAHYDDCETTAGRHNPIYKEITYEYKAQIKKALNAFLEHIDQRIENKNQEISNKNNLILILNSQLVGLNSQLEQLNNPQPIADSLKGSYQNQN